MCVQKPDIDFVVLSTVFDHACLMHIIEFAGRLLNPSVSSNLYNPRLLHFIESRALGVLPKPLST